MTLFYSTSVPALHIFTGLALLFGTFVKCKMIRFLKAPRHHKTAIDDLTLFEQLINLLNGPVISMQLLRILNPPPLWCIFESNVVCRITEATVMFALCHRSLGGTVIAGVRQVQHVICSVGSSLRIANEI